jgi:hypothetical protein
MTKKHLLGCLAVAAMVAAPAMAADMPAKAPIYKAVPAAGRLRSMDRFLSRRQWRLQLGAMGE